MYLLQTVADQTWLQGIIHEPIALIILGIIVILFIIVWRVAPKFVDKHAEFKILEINKKYEQINNETNSVVHNISDRFSTVETYIENNKRNIEEIKSEVHQLRNEMKQNNKAVLRLQIFDDSLDDYSRLEAGIEYFKLGGNGKGKAKILEIATNNPEAWDVICRNSKIIHEFVPNYFEDSVNDINRLLDYKQRHLN